jgi:hypothetical protein
MYVWNIPYITTFIVLQNTIVDSNHSMLLGRPWFKDVKVAHFTSSYVLCVAFLNPYQSQHVVTFYNFP